MLVILTIILAAIAAYLFRELCKLRGEPQIYAEVAQELHQRAHELLVRKDQIETNLQMVDLSFDLEQWKNDLAQYMDDFEHESRQRSLAQLGHKAKSKNNRHYG